MGLKKFIKNISFLCQVSLKKEYLALKQCREVSDILDSVISELCDIKRPYIHDVNTTLKILSESQKSIARFGDGEFMLIEGKDIPFQKYSLELSNRLKEVLSSQNSKICIAIPLCLYESSKERISHNWHFWRYFGSRFRMLLNKYIHPEQPYYPTEVSLLSTYSTKSENFDDYFNSIRQIWQDRDIHLIHGKGIFDNFEFDIFDNARTVTYQEAPSKNAFEEYNIILNEVLKVDNTKLIIAILGPTATILAYDLALKGYQALDLGHIAKSYDWWKRGKNLYQKSDNDNFFKPD
jgi:glycosyltransferase family protein